MAETLNDRLLYCSNKKDYCRAGGTLDHPNYGLPCITGAVYWPDSGDVTIAFNCVFCGRRFDGTSSYKQEGGE